MTVHIIGAGLAGLAAAIRLSDAGWPVVIHESSGQAGGRCRSWYDSSLSLTIDNGTHLLVGGNKPVFEFLKRLRALDRVIAGPYAFPMADLASGRHWRAGVLRLLPSLLASHWYMSGNGSLESRLAVSPQYQSFWEPLILAIMNTPPEAAAPSVFREVLRRTLWRSPTAARPYLMRQGLSHTFIEPAQAILAECGIVPRFHHPLRKVERRDDRLTALLFDDETITLTHEDRVILAVPWTIAHELSADLPVFRSSPIVNVHFRLPETAHPKLSHGFAGLLNATAQWLFLRGPLLSVTVSAAAGIVSLPSDILVPRLWGEVSKILGITGQPLATRMVKEKRATLFLDEATDRQRPSSSWLKNAVLAGDWTMQGLPCCIEAAIASGWRAATCITDLTALQVKHRGC